MAKLRRIKTGSALGPPERENLAQKQMKSRYIRTVKRGRVSAGERSASADSDMKMPSSRRGSVMKPGSIGRSKSVRYMNSVTYMGISDTKTLSGDKDPHIKAGRDAFVNKSEKRRLVWQFSANAAMYAASDIRNAGFHDYDSDEPMVYAEEQIEQFGQYAVHAAKRKVGSSAKGRKMNPKIRSSTLAKEHTITGVRGRYDPMQNVSFQAQGSASPIRVSNRAASSTTSGRNLAIRDYAQQTSKSIRSSIEAISRAIKAMIDASKIEAAAISIAGLGSTVVLVIISVVLVLAMTISSSFGEYNLELSDNDLVNIALSQVGTESGEVYCKWYGFDREVGWCAIFVSWCGTEAGLVKKGLMPKFAWVPTGVYWFQARDQWRGNNYSPQPGDIIFFDWYDYDLDEDGEEIGQDGSADHVGIVEKVEGGYVYTVEGNTTQDGICAEKHYPLGYFEILGYGEILYPDD